MTRRYWPILQRSRCADETSHKSRLQKILDRTKLLELVPQALLGRGRDIAE